MDIQNFQLSINVALLDNTHFKGPNLFSDLGENVFIPNPTRECHLTPFLKLSELC